MTVTNVWVVDVVYIAAGRSNNVTIANEQQLSLYIPTYILTIDTKPLPTTVCGIEG